MNPFRGHPLTRRLGFALKRFMRSLAAKEPLEVVGRSGNADRIEAVYIINLDRQPSRWENFQGEARRQAVIGGDRLSNFCLRVPAVDGKSLEVADANGEVGLTYPLDAQYYVDPDPRLLSLIRERDVQISMSREEIAVALSHVKAWRRIVADNRSHALILEDDVFFEAGFGAQLNRSWRELPRTHDNRPSFDLLYLSFREVDRGAQWVDFSPNLRRPIRGYWWLSGYVLSNAGARKLLGLLPVTGPVDLWMNHRFADLSVYSSPASVILQRTDLQSDNRYSILPLLSQVGVQTDKTHLILEQTKGRRPVFCVGFGRDAAAILESALGLLGYRCCNDRFGLLSAGVGRLLEENMPLLFDAYIRVEDVSKKALQVEELHPEAVFIIPTRAHADGELSAEEFRAFRANLAGRKGRVLEFDPHGASPWRSLCQFLQCERPIYPFPADALTEDVPALVDGAAQGVPLVHRRMVVQEHDVHPWIVPYARMQSFGVLRQARTHGTQAGAFNRVAADSFSSIDGARWTALEDSFPSNLAVFRPGNVSVLRPHGCRLTLDGRGTGDRAFSAASLRSKQTFRYGRFEVSLKPARAPGVVTAFFLHRTDPWQEIDVELLGSDTTKLLINVYFNPGDPGTACNFGNRGTPVVIDLTFDAAEDFHRYAIEWEPHEVRWLVDDQLVHVRGCWEPTPIPHLPMELFCSIWPPRSAELAGVLNVSDLPVSSEVRRVELFEWLPGSEAVKQRAV